MTPVIAVPLSSLADADLPEDRVRLLYILPADPTELHSQYCDCDYCREWRNNMRYKRNHPDET